MKQLEKITKSFKAKGFKLEIYDFPENDRQMHYWYGGTVATLIDMETNESYYLVANGDVRATYFDENGNEAAFVKDKNNRALFYSQMADFIDDDKQLDQLIENGYEGINPRLEIDNNNWFEIFSDYEDKSNFEEVIDADLYLDALEEALDIITSFKMDFYVNALEEELDTITSFTIQEKK